MEDLGEYFKRHLDLHKKKGTKHFGGMLSASAKKERAEKLKEHRKQTRDSLISKRRNIPVATPTPQKPTKQENPSKRLQMLAEWKTKKSEMKKAQEKKTKPIFKVGVVSAPVGLPNWDNVNVEIKGRKFRGLPFVPENHKFQPPANVKPLYFHNNVKKGTIRPSPIATRSKVTKPSELEKSHDSKPNAEKVERKKKESKSKKNTKEPLKEKEKSSENEDLKPLRMLRSKASSRPPEEKLTSSRISSNFVLPSSVEVSSDSTSEMQSPSVLQTQSKENSKMEDTEEVKTFSLILKTPKRSSRKGSDSLKCQEATPEKEARSKTPEQKTRLNNSAISNPMLPENGTDSRNGKKKGAVVVFKTPSKPVGNKKNEEEKKSCKLRVKTPARKRKLSDEEAKPQRVTRSRTIDSLESNRSNSLNISGTESNICSSSPEKSSDTQGSPAVFKTPSKLTQTEQIYISPFVTISRGKDSAKKEFALRRSKAFSPNKDFASHTSPKAGGAYFTRMLDNEISRLKELCETWRVYKDGENLPDEACSMIDVVLGQSQLLMNKKFQQFRGLIEQCEDANAEKLVTCEDLHGFWDMIYIQVENLDKRFENLNNLKAADWQEVIPEKKKTKSKKSAKGKKACASSSLKEAIKAARKKQSSSDENQSSSPFNIELCTKKKTPQIRKSALLSVQSGGKRNSSPGLVMLKVSQMIKDIELGTPAKSILKTDSSKSTSKPRSVLFKDFAEEQLHSVENNQNIENSLTSPQYVEAKPVARRSKRLSRQKLF